MTLVPPVLARTLDVDSHEMVPSQLWGEVFGPAAGSISTMLSDWLSRLTGNNAIYNPDLRGDLAEINEFNVWNIKGTSAPGAFDFERRLAVLDAMGTARQLVFPTFGLLASLLASGNDRIIRDTMGLTEPTELIRSLAYDGLDEYNDWSVRATAVAPDRIRPVPYLRANVSPEQLYAQAKDLIERGVRGLHLPAGEPPAGVSPAATELDAFWALLAENRVPLLQHVGTEGSFIASTAWGRAPAFRPGRIASHELGQEPYSFSTVHYPAMHFVQVMVLGGVFERHPQLRYGAIEVGSNWLAPLAENLDMWAVHYEKRLSSLLSMKPSEYIARNVRVCPFNIGLFEPVWEHLERYPNLQDCYCYSTDYPHTEGGVDIARKFYEKVAPLGDEVVEKFFVKNAEWILPV